MTSQINIAINANANFQAVYKEVDKLRIAMNNLQKVQAGNIYSSSQVRQIANAQNQLDKVVGSTRAFTIEHVKMADSVQKFSRNLEAGRLHVGEYFKLWKNGVRGTSTEISNLADQQVRLGRSVAVPDQLRAGYARLITDVNGAVTAEEKLVVTTKIMNTVMRDGATKLIDLGKNTQWAGRQLTVGLTMPVAMFGVAISQTFKQVDQELTRMTKVYGTGLQAPTNAAIKQIRSQVMGLGNELARSLGTSLQETASVAADLAATGQTGLNLVNATRQAVRLATLGEIDHATAVKTVVSMQNVYKLNTQGLAESINFLNAVENQTSTSLQDLVDSIPRVGPVVAQLGGSFKDTAAMMVAMKEAGVPAAQGANAIKSTLLSLINPTKDAQTMFSSFGINLKQIANETGGKPMQMFLQLRKQMEGLGNLQKMQLLEKLFGKYQASRVAALIENIGKAGSQTQTVFKLMGASVTELASLADNELKQQTQSASGRFKRMMETIKADLMPVGEAFLNIFTGVGNVADKIFSVFRKINEIMGPALDPLKALLQVGGGGALLVGPLLMLGGLLLNFSGNLMKGFAYLGMFKRGMSEAASGTNRLSAGFANLTNFYRALDAEEVAARNQMSLLPQTMMETSRATSLLATEIGGLAASFARLAAAQAAAMPGSGLSFTSALGFLRSPTVGPSSPLPRKLNVGSVYVSGGGPASGDKIPAMLTPGEAVIPAAPAAHFRPLIQGMIDGSLPKYATGGFVGLAQSWLSGLLDRRNISPEQMMGLRSGFRRSSSPSVLYRGTAMESMPEVGAILNLGDMASFSSSQGVAGRFANMAAPGFGVKEEFLRHYEQSLANAKQVVAGGLKGPWDNQFGLAQDSLRVLPGMIERMQAEKAAAERLKATIIELHTPKGTAHLPLSAMLTDSQRTINTSGILGNTPYTVNEMETILHQAQIKVREIQDGKIIADLMTSQYPKYGNGIAKILSFLESSTLIGGLRKAATRSARSGSEIEAMMYGQMASRTGRDRVWRDNLSLAQGRPNNNEVVGHIYSNAFYNRVGSASGGSSPRLSSSLLETFGIKQKAGMYDVLPNNYMTIDRGFNTSLFHGTATAAQWMSNPRRPEHYLSLIQYAMSRGASYEQALMIARRAMSRVNSRIGSIPGLINERMFGNIVTNSARQELKIFGFNNGAIVPGTGNTDTVPAMLTPGEAVIPKDATSKYRGLISAIINKNVPGYNRGHAGKSNATIMRPNLENASATSGLIDFTSIDPGNATDVGSLYARHITEQAGVSATAIETEINAWKQKNIGEIKRLTLAVESGADHTEIFNGLMTKFAEDMKRANGPTHAFTQKAEELFPILSQDLATAQRTAREMSIDMRSGAGTAQLATALPGSIVAQEMAASQVGKSKSFQKLSAARNALIAFGGKVAGFGIPTFMLKSALVTQRKGAAWERSASQEHVNATLEQEAARRGTTLAPSAIEKALLQDNRGFMQENSGVPSASTERPLPTTLAGRALARVNRLGTMGSMGISMIAPMALSAISSMVPKGNMGGAGLGGALSGMGMGMQFGGMMGPTGLLAGAVLGGAAGLVKGLWDKHTEEAQKHLEKIDANYQKMADKFGVTSAKYLSAIDKYSTNTDFKGKWDDLSTGQKRYAATMYTITSRISEGTLRGKALDTALKNVSSSITDTAKSMNALRIAAKKAGDTVMVSVVDKLGAIGVTDFASIGNAKALAESGVNIDKLKNDVLSGDSAGARARIASYLKDKLNPVNKAQSIMSGAAGSAKPLENQLKLLEKQKKVIDDQIKAEQKKTDELKRQEQYLKSQADVDQQIAEAKMRGNYIEVASLMQQKKFNTADFKQENKIQGMQNKSDAIAARIDKIQATINSINTAAQNAVNSLQQQQSQAGMNNLLGRLDSLILELQKSHATDVHSKGRNAGLDANGLPKRNSEAYFSGGNPIMADSRLSVQKTSGGYYIDSYSASQYAGGALSEGSVLQIGNKKYTVQNFDVSKRGWRVKPMATGGFISGPGSYTSDSIPAMLSNGEYVMNASAVNAYGSGFMNAVNAKRFAVGGFVGGPASSLGGASSQTNVNINMRVESGAVVNENAFDGIIQYFKTQEAKNGGSVIVKRGLVGA